MFPKKKLALHKQILKSELDSSIFILELRI